MAFNHLYTLISKIYFPLLQQLWFELLQHEFDPPLLQQDWSDDEQHVTKIGIGTGFMTGKGIMKTGVGFLQHCWGHLGLHIIIIELEHEPEHEQPPPQLLPPNWAASTAISAGSSEAKANWIRSNATKITAKEIFIIFLRRSFSQYFLHFILLFVAWKRYCEIIAQTVRFL